MNDLLRTRPSLTLVWLATRVLRLHPVSQHDGPLSVRREAWKRLATDLDRGKLQTMTNEIQLPGVLVAAPAILDGRIRGRIVVKIQ